MKVRTRRIVAVLAGGMWSWWVVLYTAAKMTDANVLHQVAMEITRSAAMMTSILYALAILVGPLVATARIWHRIGVQEQQRHCEACPIAAKRAERLTNIIPVDFAGLASRMDAIHRPEP